MQCKRKRFFSWLMPIKPGPERILNVQGCPFKSYVPPVRFRTIKIWRRSLWENFHYHSLIWEQWWLIVGSSGGSFESSSGSLVVTPVSKPAVPGSNPAISPAYRGLQILGGLSSGMVLHCRLSSEGRRIGE
jgi:hypothetical protein